MSNVMNSKKVCIMHLFFMYKTKYEICFYHNFRKDHVGSEKNEEHY